MGDARDACAGCGAPLPDGARFCGRCGRTRDDARPITVVELGRLDAPSVQTAVVTSHAPARPRPRARLALGAALVVIVAAAGLWAITADGDTPEDDATSTPTTTSVDGSTDPDRASTSTSAAPATSAVASTTPATAAPTTMPTSAPTSTIPYVNQRSGVVLDAEQRSQGIYVWRGALLYRVDLGTGRVTSRSFDTGGEVLGVMQGRVLFRLATTARALWTLPADLQGDPRPVPIDDFDVGRADTIRGDALWLVRWARSSTTETVLRRIDLAGTVRTEITLPPTVYPVGYLTDRVVVAQLGRIWTIGADGRAVPYAVGTVAAVTDRYVLWAGCDDALRCTYRLGDATRPDLGRTDLETSFLFAMGDGPGSFLQGVAPDGATVVAGTAPGGAQGIVDLATGSVLPRTSPGSALAWTSDGAWLIESLRTPQGAVATNVRTGRTVALDHAALGAITDSAALIVG